MTNTTRIGWAQLAFISAGGLIWAIRFVTIYSLAALACAKSWFEPNMGGWGGVSILIAAATGLALLANLVILVFGLRAARTREHHEGPASFIPYAASGIALLSMLAIVWESFVLMLPMCN
jgi:hypothetical protein